MIPRQLGLALTIAWHSANATDVGCPPALGHHTLNNNISIFDGYPEHETDMVPQDTGWDISSPPTYPEGYYLVCRYKGTAQVKTIPIPRDARFCRFVLSSVVPNVSCR